jgi:hypothetical protein
LPLIGLPRVKVVGGECALAPPLGKGARRRIKGPEPSPFREQPFSKIGFELARSLLRGRLQIERAREFAVPVHEIDDPGVVNRIVAGFFAGDLSCVHAKGLGHRLVFRGVAAQPDDAETEVCSTGLQNIWRVALGIDGGEKRGAFLSGPSSLKTPKYQAAPSGTVRTRRIAAWCHAALPDIDVNVITFTRRQRVGNCHQRCPRASGANCHHAGVFVAASLRARAMRRRHGCDRGLMGTGVLGAGLTGLGTDCGAVP